MITYAAFLKGINIPGQNPVNMKDLRHCLSGAGIYNVSTFAQSGNVIFETEENDEVLLRKYIEYQLHKNLGYPVTTILRLAHELKSALSDNPFDHIKTEDTIHLYITFLSDIPPFSVRGSLGVYSNDAEDARLVKRNVYIRTGNYGKTCFTNTLIEKKLGVEATTRNWATVSKMADLMQQMVMAANTPNA